MLSCGTNKIITTTRPNILFAIADDVSFPHMGIYGSTWINSPAFDRVAQKGLLFQNAFTPNAKCAPSRAMLLTGRNSWQLEEAANHWPYFPKKFKTIFESLKENGYHTGYVAKGFAPGKPGQINGKKRELVGKNYSSIKMTPPTVGIGTFDYAGNFEKFLNDKDKSQPFCFWYGSYEPHRPYEYGTGRLLSEKNPTKIDDIFDFFPDVDSVRNDLLDYAFEIEYFDTHLDKMLNILDELDELENTIVIVTADNGMPFPRVKGQAYESSNHVPLAIMWEKGIRQPGRIVDEFVSFTDFAPTLLEVANITWEESGMHPFEGRSLNKIYKNEQNPAVRTHMLIGKERHDVGRPNDWGYPVRGIRTREYLYLVNFKPSRWPAGNPETGYLNTDGSPTKTVILNQNRNQSKNQYWKLAFSKRPEKELYDLINDPDCMINVVNQEKYDSIQKNLNNQMFAALKDQGDPRVFGNGDIFDNYLYADTKHQNFYYRFNKGEISAGSAKWVNESDFEK